MVTEAMPWWAKTREPEPVLDEMDEILGKRWSTPEKLLSKIWIDSEQKTLSLSGVPIYPD